MSWFARLWCAAPAEILNLPAGERITFIHTAAEGGGGLLELRNYRPRDRQRADRDTVGSLAASGREGRG
jgi:hypothetical protein